MRKIIFLTICFTVCFCQLASATTLRVPGDYGTIQAAIDAAKAGDLITIAAGEYHESLQFISKYDLVLQGAGQESSVINPAGMGRGIGIFVSRNITIRDLAIKGGLIRGDFSTDSIDSYGAGIFTDGSDGVEISHNTITNNEGINGGGVASRNSTVLLTDNIIRDNLATNSSLPIATARGGGVFFYDSHGKISGNQILNNKTAVPSDHPDNKSPGGGIFIQSSDPEITNNTFSANQTTGLQNYGGGLYIYTSYNLSVHHNTFTGNNGLDGGGIAVIESNPTIADNLLQNNQGRWGGGLYGWHMSSAIYGNTFLANHALDGGGGILFDESPQASFNANIVKSNTSANWGGGVDVFISNCSIVSNEISNNQALLGGGVAITPDSKVFFSNNTVSNNVALENGGGLIVGDASSATITNNIIMKNHANKSGGGIVIFGNSSPTIINNTIYKNSAPKNWGGGIRVDSSSPIIINNIISGHSPGDGITSYEAISATGSQVTHAYNNLWKNNINYQGESYIDRSGSIFSDPRFVNAEAGDMQLLSISPNIHTGHPDVGYNNPDGTRNTIGFSGGPYAVMMGVTHPLFRFFNSTAGGHFYTIDAAEKDAVVQNYAWFRYEGAGFYAFRSKQSGALPVYRFFNNNAGGHFYTIDEAEKDSVIQNYPWFRYEGIGFYAYQSEQPGTLPVYRFFNNNAGGHFYTIDIAEKDAVIQNYDWFRYEGAGFYAYPSP